MKIMIFKWEGNSYGISLDKLQSANNHIKNIKKIHPFFQDFKIPKKTKSLALKSGFFFPTQEMPKIEEVEIERNIDLPYLSKEKVIGCFNIQNSLELIPNSLQQLLDLFLSWEWIGFSKSDIIFSPLSGTFK